MTLTDQVLVPREATEEMVNRGWDAMYYQQMMVRPESNVTVQAKVCYAAAIAAAPKTDIETLVEGVKIVIEENAFEPPSTTARAVLRHLFGEG